MAMPKVVPGDMPAWKTELTEKLAASRARRSSRGAGQPRLPIDSRDADQGQGDPRNEGGRAELAAAVAARYATRPSYREALEREAVQAALAAEQALRDAQAAQEAVRRRMEEAREAEAAAAEAREAEERLRAEQARIEYEQNIAVRHQVDERTQRQMDAYEARQTMRVPPTSHQPAPRFSESRHDARHDQRHDPMRDAVEDATVSPAVPLAANLIEFPRELVAARKARPRLAEGPLRDAEPASGQLRIFEVEPEAIDHRPAPAAAASAGLDWSAIRLDTPRPERAPRPSIAALLDRPPLKPASIEDRLMAALVDGALSFIGFLTFVVVFCSCTAHPPTGRTALAAAAVSLLAICVAYQWLFFRFGEGTPGMRYAEIALCTLDDDNPTRRSMQRRVGALLLSALPLGLGLIWALFDEDGLGWHDRISGTYQRSCR